MAAALKVIKIDEFKNLSSGKVSRGVLHQIEYVEGRKIHKFFINTVFGESPRKTCKSKHWRVMKTGWSTWGWVKGWQNTFPVMG